MKTKVLAILLITAVSSTLVLTHNAFSQVHAGTVFTKSTPAAFQAQGWQTVSSPTGSQLSGVDIVSENDVWAVGGQYYLEQPPIVLHYTGAGWTTASSEPSFTRNHLSSVSFSSSGSGWAVGYQMASSYNGSWTHEEQLMMFPYAVEMITSSSGWMVGYRYEWSGGFQHYGLIRQYSGGSWEETCETLDEMYLDVSMANASEGWIVGTTKDWQTGIILRRSGGTWGSASAPSTGPLRSVFALSSSEAWVVGNNGKILHCTSGTCQTVSSPTSANLWSVAMVSQDEGWAVGEGGVILHYTDGSWHSFSSPTIKSLFDLSMLNAYEGWAVGDNGTILHYTAPLPSTISGRVVDADDDPVAGVTISDGLGHEVVTDGNGNYSFSDVQAGVYTLTPSKVGCLFTPAARTVSVPPDATGQSFEARCAFDISGQVLDGSRNPFAGVQISASAGPIATTDADGRYIFTEFLSGTYTLTPTLSGYTFQPTARTVTLPPDATGQDFVILPGPVSTTLPLSGTANLPTILTYADTQGLTTTLDFPAGAVTETTTLVLTPTLVQGNTGFVFAGHAFEIKAFQGGYLVPDLTFNKPVTVTIHYSEQDVRLVGDESQLVLEWWASGGWHDVTNTCDPPSYYHRDLENNVLSVPICHLSLFSLFGPMRQIYLPLILRGH